VFTANYTWEKADMTFALSANATGPMALPEVYDLDAAGNPLPNPRVQESEPFAIANLQVEKRIGERLAVYGGVQNLLNFRQPSAPLSGLADPANAPGFSPFFDTAYAYAPNYGREGYVGVRWSLARKAQP
jgi:outer membrane receptor for ferrienterochelin and colicins